MKNAILNFLASKLGIWLAPFIAAAIAAAFAWLSSHCKWAGAYMTPDNQVEVAGFIFGLLMTAVNSVTSGRALKWAKPVQKLLTTLAGRFGLKAVEVDGVIAVDTATTAEEIHEEVLSIPKAKFNQLVKIERAKRA